MEQPERADKPNRVVNVIGSCQSDDGPAAAADDQLRHPTSRHPIALHPGFKEMAFKDEDLEPLFRHARDTDSSAG